MLGILAALTLAAMMGIISWGVLPVLTEEYNSIEVVYYQAFKYAVKLLSLNKGDNVVLTGGQISGPAGNTNTVKVETV